MHRVGQALHTIAAAVHVARVIHPPGKVDDPVAYEHLSWASQRAQPCRQVKSAATVTIRDRHGLTGVDPDAQPKRQRRICPELHRTPPLQVNRSP